jgi:hypothetical protein
MNIIGHLITLLGLYVLYTGAIVFGGFLFFLGGLIAGKLFICLRSGGVLTMVISIAYGYHNGFTPTVLVIIFVGFVLACFNSKRNSRGSDDGWGIDIDFGSFGSSSDSDGGDFGSD